MRLFHRSFTRRAREASEYEILPEDVFLDSQNISNLNIDQMEGQLERPLGRNVFYLVSAIIVLLVLGFTYRLFSMQIVEGSVYAEKADKNHLKTTPLFALRGTIADRNGELLAWNTTNATTTKEEIPKRAYVSEVGFSNLLGYVSYPKKDQSGVFWQESYIGKDGVEKQYQDVLQGVSGQRVIGINALHQVEAENVTIQPSNGENIRLTVDKGVQAKLYERMEALAHKAGFTSGAAVIMDVRNGEILAITSYPQYDNNLITNAEGLKADLEGARSSKDGQVNVKVFVL